MVKKIRSLESVTIRFKLDQDPEIIEKQLRFENDNDLERKILNLEAAYRTQSKTLNIIDKDFCF